MPHNYAKDDQDGNPEDIKVGLHIQTSWKSLSSFTSRKHLPILITGSIFALFAGCVTPILAVLLGNVFDAFTSFGAGQSDADTLRSKIAANCLGMVGLGAAGWFLNGAYFMIFVAFGEFQAASIRGKVFTELLKRDIEWFEAQREGSGAFLSGIQAYIHDLQLATSQPIGLLLQYACRSVASLILALVISWKLSLVTLAGFPIFSALIAYLSTRMNSSISAQQNELTFASQIANNAISSIDTVKCLNGQAFEGQNFATKIEQSAIHYLRQARLNSLQIALIRWMMFGMFVQGFWYGSSLARDGALTSGDVITTFWACTTAAQSIEQVLPQMIVMEKGKVASTILRKLMRASTEDEFHSESKGTIYPRRCHGDIEVNNVSFSYPSQRDKCVLNPSTLFFPAGDTTFVIGKSGSGKSTLGQLIMRFYSPTSGEILIDGHPINSLKIDWLRKNVSILEQKSVLFNDSVLQNIKFGRPAAESVSAKDITVSIELAMLDNMIEGLPRGIDTAVGSGGSFLSGGQRQRVAIARAKLRDAPILIMDEATSALDHTNRVAVMKAIRQWREGKTTIIITHDMSQILEDDLVYVLEHGSIMHSGFRQELGNRAGCEKYFPSAMRSDHEKGGIGRGSTKAKHTSSALSAIDSLRLPKRSFHRRRSSWAQHHLPPGFRSSTYGMAAQRHSFHANIRSDGSSDSADQRTPSYLPFNNSIPDLTSPLSPVYDGIAGKDIEMVEINSLKLEIGSSLQYASPSPIQYLNPKSSKRLGHKRKASKPTEQKKDHQPSLAHIMGTIVPNLDFKQRLILLVGVLSALAHASATPVFSYCLSQLISTFYAGSQSANLARKWSLAVLGVSCGDGLSSFFMHYSLEFCAEAWLDSLRGKAFERILGQPKVWFEKEGHGSSRLASYLDQNGEDMRNLLGRFAGFVIVAAGIMIMAVIWSLIVCWKLTLISLACGPFIYAITRGFEGTNGLWERKCSSATSVAIDIFAETFSEIRTVRSLTLETYFQKKHVDAVTRCLKIGLKRALYTGLLFGMVESTVMFACALIFYYGALLAASEFAVDDVVQVFSLLLFSIGYAAQILSWIPQINTSREIASRLLELSKLSKFGSHEHRGSLIISNLTPIRLRNVYFRYPSRPDTVVLKDVSMTISQNTCTAIVGRSGSGKSTIASLLVALYESPESQTGDPTITLGGEDISRLHVPTLRSHIAIVSQQPTICPESIYANIIYGIELQSPMCSMDSVRAAAKAAGIDDFITSLPKGYWTVIGDGGIGLSGGQKQRIVIARGLLRHPQILILDEATSGLDPAGAEIVRRTIQHLVSVRPDLTVIIITHSKEMIEIADHVIVLDQGVVVEDGSYRVLSQRIGGRLYELINDPEDET
ncbi:hypothetical protein N7520_001346 [Penicillium odoratum]|uniref:uncharacterized protein n=1 Tax=Penicillium odoratum TaxID=1167516 RepID=UPI0025468571|nr:uncharacterized protein N7520_001346 [Penicillium odoratum]KAJ5778100.1 hypothetical protein N7520_001346 [Penicillium odoratum]